MTGGSCCVRSTSRQCEPLIFTPGLMNISFIFPYLDTSANSDLLNIEHDRMFAAEVLQGSVVTCVRYDAMYDNDLGATLLQNPTMKEFLQLVNIC